MTISTITYNRETSQFGSPIFLDPKDPNKKIDPTQKTIFLIHGYNSTPVQAFGNLSNSLQNLYGTAANIINVDWSSLANVSLDYSNTEGTGVADRLPTVALALSKAFEYLKIDPTKTEIIGHSLGAHVAGIAGQEFKKGHPPINQIIGLDPAGVLYEATEPDRRISPDDAQRVVVIHSSNSLTGAGSNGEWGLGLYRDDLGHLDIYVKQYGQVYGESIYDPNDHDLAVDVYEQFVKGLWASGSNEFGRDLRFNDFVNLQKLDDPNFTGEYTINLDTKFSSDASNQSFSSNGVNNSDTYSFDTDTPQGVDTINETTIALKTAHNSYIRADEGVDEGPVKHRGLFQSGDLGIGQEFEIVQQDDGKIGLKTYLNLYVRAGKFWVVDHVSGEIGPWEKFEVVDRGDGKIGLRTHWGDSYLQAFPFGNGLGTISQSWNLGDWETFTPIAQNQDVDILDFSQTTSQSISVDLRLPGLQQINGNLALTLGTTLAGVTYVDIENASGGSLNDTLTGNDLNNVLRGNGGNDVLDGAAGNDVLQGGDEGETPDGSLGDTLSGAAGNDTLHGGTGSDTANYYVYGATQDVNVSLATGLATNDGFGNQDTLSGVDHVFGGYYNDYIVGDDFNNKLDGFLGNDTLIGAAGDDFLYGADGDDVLDGGAGNDMLTGAGGADTFVLSPGDQTIETITDFSWDQGDKINIAPGPFLVSLDQFAYSPGEGTLSWQGTPFATLSSLPQDFNVQTDIIITSPA